MTAFSCPIIRIGSVAAIPGASEIEHARVFACDVIVPKGRFKAGDLAIYVPPDTVLPPRLVESLKGEAKLFGERRNRTKPFRLMGAFSEGLLIGPLMGGSEGEDAAQALGAVKYEPPVPRAWRGTCVHLPHLTISYDIESARRHPNVFQQGEQIELSEKLHGTLCAVGYAPGINHPDLMGGDTLIYSKGLGRTGHTLKATNDENLYVRTAIDLLLRERIKDAFNGRPATVFGEIYGEGVQDLGYGKATSAFAVFDVYLGISGRGHWLSRAELTHICGEIAPLVPVLYQGPLRDGIIRRWASGRTVAGHGRHLAEGVVIRPLRDRDDPRIGRAILKYVSPEYLTRQSGTEFN
jgi:RNA ligase (TIGR02306 family)